MKQITENTTNMTVRCDNGWGRGGWYGRFEGGSSLGGSLGKKYINECLDLEN